MGVLVDGFGGFQSTPPEWEATGNMVCLQFHCPFQSTPPEWEATRATEQAHEVNRIFQSTPPEWEATSLRCSRFRRRRFQSTPPEWEATYKIGNTTLKTIISIHASRVGGDT